MLYTHYLISCHDTPRKSILAIIPIVEEQTKILPQLSEPDSFQAGSSDSQPFALSSVFCSLTSPWVIHEGNISTTSFSLLLVFYFLKKEVPGGFGGYKCLDKY